MGRYRRFWLPALMLAVVAATVPATAEEGEARAILELKGSFLYAEDPILVRLSIGNEGEKAIQNPVRGAVLEGFQVKTASGETIKPTGKPTAREPDRPSKLNPMAFYGTIVDLTEIYPELKRPGRYSIGWESGGISSTGYDLTIIPRYDPSKSYQATIETGLGQMVLDFFPGKAPIAVKAFIDMANSGFYDGLFISEIRAGDYIVAGDPGDGDNGGRRPVTFPAEMNDLPPVAGTVILKPVMASPPGNSSVFMILLQPKPVLKGQATVFAQVIQGLDVARKISERPASSASSRSKPKPIKDIEIRRIVIRETPEVPRQAPPD